MFLSALSGRFRDLLSGKDLFNLLSCCLELLLYAILSDVLYILCAIFSDVLYILYAILSDI